MHTTGVTEKDSPVFSPGINFRLGGLPGLIHWKIVAAWLKTKDLSDWMLMLTSRTRYFKDKITQLHR